MIDINIPGNEENIDATVAVMITPDRMKAYITITPPGNGGKTLGEADITDALANSGVVHGINHSNIEALTKYPLYNEKLCIAEGSLPVHGQSGKVKFHFDIRKNGKPTILEDGRVDFRELNLIEIVKEEQALCTMIPPIPGIPGKTVTGEPIHPVNGKPVTLPKGKNVAVSEDGMSLVSKINGQVSFQDGKVNVFSTYEVEADVDTSTGNISFIGNVCIRGNVLSGFTVEAGGNVEVWGVVEGAVIKAQGDIILRRGMQGMGKGMLISDGDVIARYIENSNVEARNNIKAEAIMHSNVKCGNVLELSGRKGLLVGGNCRVGKEIIAKVIGSHMATATEVEVGIDPALRERYKALREEVSVMESDLKKADQAIAILKKLEAVAALSSEKQEILAKSMRTKLYYSNKIIEMKDELAVLEINLQQDATGKIRCMNFVYPGTKISIGTCKMFVRENLQYCTIYRDGADIRIGSLDR